MTNNPFGDDEDSWMKGFDALEYNDPLDEDKAFEDDLFDGLFFPKGLQPNQPAVTMNDFVQEMTSNQSLDFNPPEFTSRRTISSPLIALTPPPQSFYSQHQPFQIPGVQSTLNFSQSKISRLLAPIDTQARAQEDAEFMASLHDMSLIIQPHVLGFIPYQLWHDRNYTFGELVTDFFQRKNHSSCRFSYKLYNSLKLSQISQRFAFLCGVSWLNNNIVRVDKRAFARLLGIKSIDGSLFHQQGNFPSHGFVEVAAEDVPRICPEVDLTGVDFDSVRLLYHADGIFVRSAKEADLASCKWASCKK